MLFALSDVVWRCAGRRGRKVLVENPLLGVLLATLVGGAPVAAALGGRRVAAGFDAAAAHPAFAEGLALGIATTGAIVGATVALAAPGSRALGPQLSAAPAPRVVVALGLTVLPVAAAATLAALPLLVFAVAVAGPRGPALVGALVAGALVGASAGEAAKLLTAGARAGIAVAAAGGAIWLATPAVVGAPVETGPAAPVVALVGGGSVANATLALAAVAAIAAVAWTWGCSLPRRPNERRRVLRRDRGLPRRAPTAVAVACARMATRHPELRLPAVATVVVPAAAAIALGAAQPTTPEALALLVGGLALMSAAIYPPAAQGLARGARWQLAAAPQRPSTIASAAAAGGAVVALALVAAALVVALPTARAGARTYIELEAAGAFVIGGSAAAGALLPWRAGEVVQQLASYGAVLAVVLALWILVGRFAAAWSFSSGPVFSLLVGNAVLLLGVAAAAAAAAAAR